jgi:hypothetical protein
MARQQQNHARRLHAGREPAEAGRIEQGCPDDGARHGHKEGSSTSGYRRVIRLVCLYCVLICLSLRSHIFRKSFGMYGGDDGARTRDLCRDRKVETRNRKKLGVADGSLSALRHH